MISVMIFYEYNNIAIPFERIIKNTWEKNIYLKKKMKELVNMLNN